MFQNENNFVHGVLFTKKIVDEVIHFLKYIWIPMDELSSKKTLEDKILWMNGCAMNRNFMTFDNGINRIQKISCIPKIVDEHPLNIIHEFQWTSGPLMNFCG